MMPVARPALVQGRCWATISGVSPPRRLYLHVGTRKTGTSFLQRVVYTAPDSVREQGLGLPLSGRPAHLRLLQSIGALGDDTLPAKESAALHRRLQRNLAATDLDRALVTHEDLAAAGPEPISRLLNLLDDVEVHVVITARDLARQIPSEWQQCVKSRLEVPYEEYVDAVVERRGPDAALFWARQDIADVAERWGSRLPPAHVHVVTVPPSGSPPDLLAERFWTVMGVPPTALATGGGVNPSLGAEQAELLRRVNAALGERLSSVREEYRPVVKTLVRRVLTAQDGRPLRLPAALLPWCRDVSAGIVAQLQARGYDVVGDLADLMPPPAAPDAPSPVPVGDREVAAAAVEALARVLTLQHAARAGDDDDPERLDVAPRDRVADADRPDQRGVEDSDDRPSAPEAASRSPRWRRAVAARLLRR